MLWHSKNLDMTKKIRIWIFYGRFCEKRPFFGVRNDLRSGLVCSFSKQSHLTVLTKRTNKTWSQVIPDPKKWPFFTKLAVKNSNSYFLVKVLTCPNSLDVRASTNVKRGQKFQLEPDQNPIRTWVEPDKSRCINSERNSAYPSVLSIIYLARHEPLSNRVVLRLGPS